MVGKIFWRPRWYEEAEHSSEKNAGINAYRNQLIIRINWFQKGRSLDVGATGFLQSFWVSKHACHQKPWMVLTEQSDVIQTLPCPIRTGVLEHKGNVLSHLCLLFPGLSPLLSQDVGYTYCYSIWQIWNSYF